MIQLQFRLKFLGHDFQNCTLRARGSFRGKTYGVRFFFNSATVSGFERKLFGFMVKTVRQPCQKCTFSASGAKRRKFCFEKLYQFWTIFWLQGGSFRTLSGIFQKFRQNRIFVSNEIFWNKICLSSKKVFVLFVNFEQTIFGLLTRRFWKLLSELQLLVHSNVFMNDIFIEKEVFFPNPLLSVGGIFSCFRWKFYGRVAKSFFVSEVPFMKSEFLKKNTYFLRIFSDLFLRFSMKLQQSCKNFTLCLSARGLFWEETFVLKKV